MCLPRCTSTRTFSSKCSKDRRSCLSSIKWGTSTYHCMTSCQSRNSIPCFSATSKWWCTCLTREKTVEGLIALTSSTCWILSNPSTWEILSSMPTTKEWLLRTKPCRWKQFKSLRSGGTSLPASHLSAVSTILTLSDLCLEHKGKTLHLLKEKTKDVPQSRKRRKLTVYGEDNGE